MQNLMQAVRSLLIPVSGGQLLLPTAVIAEITPYQEPQKVTGSNQDCLLGMIDWRQQTVPMLDIDNLLQLDPVELNKDARIVVLYGLENVDEMPFYGFIARDVPHTLAIQAEHLTQPIEANRKGILFQVSLSDNALAWLPDVPYFENLLRKSLSSIPAANAA